MSQIRVDLGINAQQFVQQVQINNESIEEQIAKGIELAVVTRQAGLGHASVAQRLRVVVDGSALPAQRIWVRGDQVRGHFDELATIGIAGVGGALLWHAQRLHFELRGL